MPISGAFGVWGYSEKSSGGFQTIGALKMYGLLEDSGAKEARKVKLTKHALDYFRDEREEVRSEKLQAFATNPRLFNTLFNKHWGPTVPDDAIARSVLKVNGELNEQSARSALGIYKENMAFAKPKAGGSLGELADGGGGGDDFDPPPIKMGDYIQWTSGGADQFSPPRRVTWISDDGAFVRAHGSPVGIPTGEVVVVPPPAPPKPSVLSSIGKAKQMATNSPDASQASQNNGNPADVSVLLVGNRLQITADVDEVGLAKLKQILDKYEEILKLL
jgi:hypothetical protein